MRFKSLAITNFGPYRGTQHIIFPSDDIQNVMLVFGDNMRGKTSLINAIRWTLFGHALNRQGTPIPLVKLINVEEQAVNNWTIAGLLHFEVNGKQYELSRTAEAREFRSAPKEDSHFRVTLSMRVDGESIPSAMAEHEISRFMPRQIARFYLFDAELLQEYELLVSEESDHARAIKDAIEQVLGVPALIHGRDELRLLQKEAQKAQADDARQDKSRRALAEQILQLDAEITELEGSRGRLAAELEAVRTELDAITQEFSTYAEIRDQLAAIERLRVARERTKSDKALSEAARRNEFSRAWRDLLQPAIELRRAEISSRIEALTKHIGDRAAAEAKLHNLERIVQLDRCPLCEQDVPQYRRASAAAEALLLRSRLSAEQTVTAELAILSARRTSLDRIRPAGVGASLRTLQRHISHLDIELIRIETEIETLEDAVRNHDHARIADLQRQRDGRQRLRAMLEVQLERAISDLDAKERKKNGLSTTLQKMTGDRPNRATRQAQALNDLVAVFAESIDTLRDRLRQRVALEATSVFKRLTTERTYQHLDINTHYGLTIIDAANRPVSIRSAGAEQVVALSLLASLNRTAQRHAPIVIDTPFARLDPKHRQNILEFIPTMASQVVFLVHEGELPRGDLKGINSRIASIYELRRVSASHTEIVRL